MALVALIQPWALALWRRFFRPGSIEIYETGAIEVTYGTIGATIGLHGTLRGRDRDLFVRSSHLLLQKQRDQSRHRFDWSAFRSAKLFVGRPQEMTLELPAGFMLLTSQPYRYNIVFTDSALSQDVRNILDPLRRAWTEFIWGRRATLPVNVLDPSIPEATRQEALRGLYPDFAREGAHVDAYTAVDRLSYWQSGTYDLTMTVGTAEPARQFSKAWRFDLTEADAANLRLNSIKAIQEACGQYFGQYNFAYPRYQAPS